MQIPSRGPAFLSRRKIGYTGVGLGLVALAVLLQPAWVSQLSPDRNLHPDTLLALGFLRLFLALLGLIAPFWPDLDDRRRRPLLIGLLLIVTVAARAVRLDTPYLDQHAHRQTDVATIARNFYEKDPNILLPQVNWRADAPNYVESTFPLVPWLAGLGYRVVGEQPWVGRGLVLLFSLLAVLATFGLVDLYWGQATGFLAGLFLALSPLAIYFGRALIDDMPAIALAIAGIWGVAVWAHDDAGDPPRPGSRRALVLGLVMLTGALLVKVVTLYAYFPLLAILLPNRRMRRNLLLWALFGLPLVPTVAWYAWAHQLGQLYLTFGLGGAATGEPASYGAFSKWGSLDFVLSWSFVRQIGGRILHEVLTPAGLAAAGVGLAAFGRGILRRGPARGTASLAGETRSWQLAGPSELPGRTVFAAHLLGVLLLTGISGRAQWYHNYYQLPFAAALAPFVGLGVGAIVGYGQPRDGRPSQATILSRLGPWAALGLFLLLAIFSARKLPYYYGDWQGWILPEVEYVQGLTGPDDRIITVTREGSPTLLYHLHRPGWVVDYLNPIALDAVPSHLKNGARLLILQDIEYWRSEVVWRQPWLPGLELLVRTDRYAIYRAP